MSDELSKTSTLVKLVFISEEEILANYHSMQVFEIFSDRHNLHVKSVTKAFLKPSFRGRRMDGLREKN